MVFGTYYLTLMVDGPRARVSSSGASTRSRPPTSAATSRCTPRSGCVAGRRVIRSRSTAFATRQTESAEEDPPRSRRRPVGSSSTWRCRPTSASSTTSSASAPPRSARSSSSSPRNYHKAVVAESLDAIKELGFGFATRSGLTISIDDVKTPPDKLAILDRYEKEAEKAEAQFKRGIITDDERRQKEIEIWTSANSEVGRAMERTLATIAVQPARHDGRLRRPWEPPAGAPDRRHEGARLEPPRRDDPAPDRLLVPRGTVGARVLHLDPRRPQGTRRHRTSHRRLRLPDAPTGRRRPGADRARGRLRDDPWHLDRRRRPRHRRQAELPRDPRLRTGPRRGGQRSRTGRPSPSGRCSSDADIERMQADPSIDRIRVRSVLTCESTQGVCARSVTASRSPPGG